MRTMARKVRKFDIRPTVVTRAIRPLKAHIPQNSRAADRAIQAPREVVISRENATTARPIPVRAAVAPRSSWISLTNTATRKGVNMAVIPAATLGCRMCAGSVGRMAISANPILLRLSILAGAASQSWVRKK